MAAVKDGGKIQIVFLVDVHSKQHIISPEEIKEICKLRFEAISLSVLRLLLYFNSSAVCSNQNRPLALSWGFKFFNSRTLNFEYKRRRFYELDSQSFERFEKEMKEKFESICCVDNGNPLKQSCAGAKALSCSLTEILHDFPWISPDISSPLRNLRSRRTNDITDGNKKVTNLLFVISDCPLGNNDVGEFLDKSEIPLNNDDGLTWEIFSSVLYKEFRSTCHLSFFWIDSGFWCLAPNKMKNLVKDWSGYKMMKTTTRKLAGNLLPISSLIQDLGAVFNQPFSTIEKTESKNKSLDVSDSGSCETMLEHKSSKVINKTFQFSFGQVVKAFLSGSNIAGLNYDSSTTTDNLFHGSLVLKDHKICCIKLSPMVSEVQRPTKCREHQLPPTSDIIQHCTQSNPNVSKKSSVNSEKPLRLAADNLVNKTKADENDFQEQENAFFIKGVISRYVSPSWFHPTKLYSCVSYEAVYDTDDFQGTTSSSEMLQQLLALISSKDLNLVIEFCDVGSCSSVIGVLQPVTSACAVVSVVKTEMLLMIEKLLLRQRSHGYSLALTDLVSNERTSARVVSVTLHENITIVDEDETTGPETVPMFAYRIQTDVPLERRKSNLKSREKIDKSHIRDIDCKQRKNNERGKEVFLKLKEYYARKQNGETRWRSEETNTQQPLHRGCQDISQKNKPSKEKEVESKTVQKRSEVVCEPHKVSGENMNPEETDGMETDESCPNIIDIKTVEELKTCLEEDYQKCVNSDLTAAMFSSRTFSLIEQLKSSGELKDLDHALTILKSSVLHDYQVLREMIESREENTDKKQIIQEYKIQVFLRLDMATRYKTLDQGKLADEITAMLRAISFEKDPTYLTSFLKNTIITRYADNLSKLLCLVYDGLMQKPPKEILSPSRVSSEEDTPLKSCKEVPSVSSKSESTEEPKNSRALVRRHSMMDTAVKRREIVIPVKGKSTKNQGKEKRQTRSSSNKMEVASKPVTPVKRVRRNLFMRDADGNERRTSPRKQAKTSTTTGDKLTRRHSIASFSQLKKVVDTPVCKQVSRRMLRRQEWARRRSKAVIDKTVVGESPLKDEEVIRPFPRKASTFYSTSSTSTFPAPKLATSSERNDDATAHDRKPDGTTNVIAAKQSNRKLPRALSVASSFSAESQASPRKKLTRFLSLKESASSTVEENTNNESFSEVFLDSAPIESSFDPNKSTRGNGSGLPETNTSVATSIQPTSTQTVNSSSSLSMTSPVASYTSPSQFRCSLSARKPFHSPSPVLFKSPNFKTSPCPGKVFDIAIPLTPVKSPCISPRINPSTPSKLSCIEKSLNTRVQAKQDNPLEAQLEHSRLLDDEGDSESVVKTTPQLDRKRSLVSKVGSSKMGLNSSRLKLWRKKSTDDSTVGRKNVGDFTLNDKHIDESTERDITVDCSVVDSTPQTSEHQEVPDENTDVGSSNGRQQSDIFASPVATKRKRHVSKRERNTECVSPLNQILKQRKNNRSSPGTSQEVSTKPKTALTFPERQNEKLHETSLRHGNNNKQNTTKKTHRQSSTGVEEHSEDEEWLDDLTDQVYPISARLMDEITTSHSPSKTTSPTSHPTQSDSYISPLSKRSFSQPHFTPKTLSAGSLKQLEESPVLIASSPSTSHSRKWSERLSPMTSPRKRLRHDS